VRTVIRHPVKATHMTLGHKLEVIYGEHTRRRHMPPKIPKHPMQDVDQNMNELLTYNDLKIRWQWTTRFGTSKMKIARHWKPKPNHWPKNKPTSAFLWHREMPHREPLPEMPAFSKAALAGEGPAKKLDMRDAFCVFKTSPIHQHKVTVGDVVQCEKLHRREAGEQIVFGTVLLVGTKEFTAIGKPIVPYAKVKATIEQQTLCGEQLIFKYKRGKKQSRFLRKRQFVTTVRIDEIVCEPEESDKYVDPPPPKPVRLLDLWANRWLDPVEKDGIELVDGPEGPVPAAAELYDGSEHQPGSYHRRGLTSCYRFYPDPQHTHWKL